MLLVQRFIAMQIMNERGIEINVNCYCLTVFFFFFRETHIVFTTLFIATFIASTYPN